MELNEKELIEKTKNILMSNLFFKGVYVDLSIQNIWRQAYIIDMKPNNRYDIIYLGVQDQLKRKNDVPIFSLDIIGSKANNSKQSITRNRCLSNYIFQLETEKVVELLKQRINEFNIDLGQKIFKKDNNKNDDNKENKENTDIINDYKGYNLHQFLSGAFIDCLAFIYNDIDSDKSNQDLDELILICLDIVIFVLEIIKNNLNKIKMFLNNRKLLILDNIFAVLASFELILANINFIFIDDFSKNESIIEKKSIIINTCYQLILNNVNNYNIPISVLVKLIAFITMNNHTKKSIIKFQQTAVFNVYLKSIKNLSEFEIKNIKKLQKIEEYSKLVIKRLFNPNNTKLINQCYFSAILLCLKCNILEKKISAINCINDIISEKEFNEYFYEFLIVKNKILDIFFDESTHDEVIKRSNDIFKYLASFDKLDEEIIERLIKTEYNKEIYKNIMIDVIGVLPFDKKDKFFEIITKKLDFYQNSNDIDYLLKLVESCSNKKKIISNIKKENKNNENEDKEKEKDKDIENDEEKCYKLGLKGLNILFDYIIKDFDINKPYDKNNVDKSIEIFNKTKFLRINDIFNYIEKLFENIKTNEKHISVVQSLVLIIRLINKINSINNQSKDKKEDIFQKLDNKYNIFNLIINDLKRYINLIEATKENPEENKIYEGIYPHKLNIEKRLNFIFFFTRDNCNNKGLKMESKEHLEKIYSILKNPLFHKDLITFFNIFALNSRFFPNDTLNTFLDNIIKNKNEFDLVNFSQKEMLAFLKNIFLKINRDDGAIYWDSKSIRVKKQDIKLLDLMLDILVKNKNAEIQNQVCDLLHGLCLNLSDYKTDFCQKYWKNYIDKITSLFQELQKEKNYKGLNGIIKLIDMIYSSSCNFAGKIPRKEDTHQAEEPFELYHFCCPEKKNKTYKIRVGEKDKILQMRWKLGYYYDIQINNLVFEDINKKRYSFKDEESIFFDVFPPNIYCPEDKDFVLVNVYSVPDQFLKIEGNPKELIEKNEIIFNNLLQNLYKDVPINDEIKQKIWNIITKFPKDIYINNEIKKYGQTKELDEKKLEATFNPKEVYILTYILKCIMEYMNDKKIQETFLYNFINLHNCDENLYDIFFNINTNPNKCKLIDYELLSILFNLLEKVEKYKKEQKDEEDLIGLNGKDEVLNKISLIIINLIKINFDVLYKNSHFNRFDIIDSVSDDNKNSNTFIIKKINKMIFDLLENIINFTDLITNNDNSYLEYLFKKQDLFKNIFFYDFIKCEKEEMKKLLKAYLSKHLFQNEDKKYVQNYFEIILSVKAFNELINNDINGSYFKSLCSLMKKYDKNKDKNEIDEKHMEQLIQIIDLIINYIQTQCESIGYFQNFDPDEKNIEVNDDFLKDSKIEGILIFLKNILNLCPKKLVSYLINKIDAFDLFLIKCIMRKCNKNPLDTKKMLCISEKSLEAVFNLIIFILKNLPEDKSNELQSKIWQELDNHHKVGFWKTNKISDWKLEPREIYQNKYIGLENMTSTCYMNSILQQFFMIPMLRESILSINNPKKDTVLFQLQLLFSALKTYEYKYYNPKPFVIKSGLSFYEQMDADEYYGQLIDRIENDIKSLYPNNEECPYKDLFKFFFGIKVLDELKFVDCGHKRCNEFYYNNIQLEIKGFKNIKDSLKNYCKIEIMDGDNKINCEVCNTKRTCHKRQIFKSLPNILVIALKRFEFDYDTMYKIKVNDYFEFPFELDMNDYLVEENTEKNTIYELTGITIHDGVADFGHYYDLIKDSNNNWYKFNDITVREFSKENIPEEAFGEKNEDELIKDELSETEKNNAYILVYTKKNFDKEKIEVLENNFKTKLALPPYSKMSNINEENKSIINCQMFKYWTLENITNQNYQNFIVCLLKIDLSRNYNKNIEEYHPEIFNELKEEEYIVNNGNENKENEENKKDNRIFEYGLRYYFNIMLRTSIKEREYMSKYDEIIKIYIENDIDKCQYVLEEFSDNDAINEYLVFCPVEENIQYTIDIIFIAFKKYYNNEDKKDKTLLFNFINSLICFIYYNIDNICLEYVFELLNKIIHVNKENKEFIKYLKDKNIELWIRSFENGEINEEDETNIDLVMSDNNWPKLKSKHFILTEKIKLDDISDLSENNGRDNEFNEAYEKKLKEDTNTNYNLIHKLGRELYKEK